MNENEYTTIQVKKRDARLLRNLQKDKHLIGIWAIVEKINDMIIRLKLREELK